MATPRLADDLSVVIITMDRKAEVCQCLERLAALNDPPGVILVDNGSRDGTTEAVGERFPAVRVMAPGRNLGAAGRNLGVAAATTRYVAFCDDDTWWEEDSLQRAVAVMDRHPRLAVVTGRILVEPGGEEDPVCADMEDSGLPVASDVPGRPLVSFLAGASVVRRSAFLMAGGFEDLLLIGGEEELLAADLLTQGWALSYLPELVVHHQASGLRDPHLRRRQGIRNTLWFTWLRRPARSAVRRTAATLRRVPRDSVSAAAMVEVVQGLPWVLRSRRVVPPAVEALLSRVEAAQLSSGSRRYVS